MGWQLHEPAMICAQMEGLGAIVSCLLVGLKADVQHKLI